MFESAPIFVPPVVWSSVAIAPRTGHRPSSGAAIAVRPWISGSPPASPINRLLRDVDWFRSVPAWACELPCVRV